MVEPQTSSTTKDDQDWRSELPPAPITKHNDIFDKEHHFILQQNEQQEVSKNVEGFEKDHWKVIH
jgi:hypothetical protein